MLYTYDSYLFSWIKTQICNHRNSLLIKILFRFFFSERNEIFDKIQVWFKQKDILKNPLFLSIRCQTIFLHCQVFLDVKRNNSGGLKGIDYIVLKKLHKQFIDDNQADINLKWYKSRQISKHRLSCLLWETIIIS